MEHLQFFLFRCASIVSGELFFSFFLVGFSDVFVEEWLWESWRVQWFMNSTFASYWPRKTQGPLWKFRIFFGFQGRSPQPWSIGKRNIEEKNHAVLNVVLMCFDCFWRYFFDIHIQQDTSPRLMSFSSDFGERLGHRTLKTGGSFLGNGLGNVGFGGKDVWRCGSPGRVDKKSGRMAPWHGRMAGWLSFIHKVDRDEVIR